MRTNVTIRIPSDVPDLLTAKEQVRQLLAQNDPPSEITVLLGEGTYSNRDFVFGVEDCSEKTHVTYRAEGHVTLDGGISIPKAQWMTPDDAMMSRFPVGARPHICMISLTAFGLTREDWGEEIAIGAYETSGKYDDAPKGCGSEFFTADRRMTKARYPNIGEFAHLEAIADVGDVHEFPPQNYHRDWYERRNHRGGAYIIDRDTAARVAQWKHPTDAWMFGYFFFDWADSSTPVTFKIENRVVYPKFVSGYAARAGAPYYFYNVPEELDSEGEWYLDRETGNLYFWPYDGAQDACFSYSDKPLIVCRKTENMTFSGFVLTDTMSDGAVIEGNGITLSDLLIKNIAGTGIRITGYDNLVKDCEITRTGRGGIYVTGGDRASLTPGQNRVTNNFIHDFSEIYQTYQGGIDLRGVGNIADHNEICGSPHTAIFYGGNDHLIEYNDIHDVVLLSSDAGAIYAGFDWAAHGCVVRYNRLTNIGGNHFAPDGIYWDDGLSGQTAYGNILINVKKYGFLVGGGRENVVEGNVIIDNGIAALEYDDRNRDGFVNNGWSKQAVDTPDAPHWQHLAEVPYTEEPWKSKYPQLSKLKTDLNTDPDDPDFPINPAYSHMVNNIVIAPKNEMYSIADSVHRFSTVENNVLYATREDAGWDNAAGNFREDAPVYRDVPAFQRIPVEKIGRKENAEPK